LNIAENGKKNNLEFLFFKPGSVTKKEFYGIIPINIKIQGKYSEIAKFFWDIGNLERIVKVNDLRFIPLSKSDLLQINGQLETYIFLKEKLNEKPKPKKKK
jgi:type IV pilus assembly protein PilO